MIISNSRKFIYVHIPKCGGTSVSSFLEERLLPQDMTLNLSPSDGWGAYLNAVEKKYGLNKHSTAQEIAKAVQPDNFKDYFVFTFCRNPFARAYSIFTFTKRADARLRPDSARYKRIKDMSFEDFLKTEYVQEHQLFAARLQSDWVRDAPVPVRRFKLEKIDTALGRLAERFYGTKANSVSAPRKNFSAGKDDWRRMSPEAEKIILSVYKEDFDRFEYPHRVPRLSNAE
ncbi:MAG: sulfotransferase family 2 domain-containing protein [Pelagimonas sp.]|uniref:sulfotransferase family 2 domain-containing protein n=1 Tax=Pelagimonas sp. TaxID=2073170 RepID=UPI003D6A9535